MGLFGWDVLEEDRSCSDWSGPGGERVVWTICWGIDGAGGAATSTPMTVDRFASNGCLFTKTSAAPTRGHLLSFRSGIHESGTTDNKLVYRAGLTTMATISKDPDQERWCEDGG